MADELKCWRCGFSLQSLSLPLARRDECPDCLIELHVCRMCEHFDPGVARACREDDAEEVKEKDRANFCDYFKPSATAFDAGFAQTDAKAREQLDGLFEGEAGQDEDDKDDNWQAADDLFK
jgi:hypothetical protein